MGTQVRGGSFSPLHDENPKQPNKADPGSAGAAAPRLGVNGVPSDMKGFSDVVGEHLHPIWCIPHQLHSMFSPRV